MARLTETWGAPESDPDLRDDAFRFRAQIFGNVIVALPPDRGRNADRRADYHDPSLPPRHALVAFGLWLQHVARADALVHMGAHGTLEWLPGKAVALTAAALRDNILEYAGQHTGTDPSIWQIEGGFVVSGANRISLVDLHAAGVRDGHRFEAKRKAYLSPRTTAFNVHGIRLAVHLVTGETRILHSVHAADIGRLINPVQCRGQLDGAIAMGIGWALTENMVHNAEGRIVNPALRNYRIPAFADLPRNELYFADTYDKIGPLGAKSQGEAAINPVAPAISNAIKNATGVRCTSLPFTAARIFSQLINGEPPVKRVEVAEEPVLVGSK